MNIYDSKQMDRLIGRVTTARGIGMTDLEIADHFVGTDLTDQASPEDVFLALAAAKLLESYA